MSGDRVRSGRAEAVELAVWSLVFFGFAVWFLAVAPPLSGSWWVPALGVVALGVAVWLAARAVHAYCDDVDELDELMSEPWVDVGRREW